MFDGLIARTIQVDHGGSVGSGAVRGLRCRILLYLARLIVPTTVLVGLSIGGPVTSLRAGPIIFTQVPVDGAAADAGRSVRVDAVIGLPAGSRIVTIDPSRPDIGVVNMTPDFFSASQPDLSFDGKRVLFVGRQSSSSPFEIWEMNTDGKQLRRVAAGPGDVSRAIYLSTIYTLDAEEPVYQIGFCVGAGDMPRGAIYTCRMDGTRVRRLTFDPYGASSPFQLSDGRLLFSRHLPGSAASGASSPAGATDWLTVHTDGTDLSVFATAHEAPAMRSMPTETRDGWVVYVKSKAGAADRGGSLIAVKRTRSLHTKRIVAQGTDGPYHSPFALSDGSLLVSYRPREERSYGLYILDSTTGRRVSELYDDPEWHDLYAVAIGPRPIPAGRSSVVDENIDHGMLYCMDAYLSDRDAGRAIRRGQIKRLQVFKAVVGDSGKGNEESGEPVSPASQNRVREVLLGDVPVRSDGSFALRVPPRTPLRLQTLDENGKVLQAMESYVWVMPRESRGCIGCHEDRELTPPNRHVEALRKEPHLIGLDATKRREHAIEQRYKRKSSE